MKLKHEGLWILNKKTLSNNPNSKNMFYKSNK